MKTRYFWICVMVLVLSPFAKAESDKVYSDRRLSEEIDPIKRGINSLTEAASSNTAVIIKLNERIQKLESKVSELQETVDRRWNNGAKNLDDLGTKVKGTNRNANIALWISLSIVLSVSGVLILVVWPRKSRTASLSPTLSDKHKCPRCGWEHDPGDTVCKNPNCKTQF